MKLWLQKNNLLSIMLVTAIVAIFTFTIFNFRILHPVNGDFSRHNQYAVQLLRGEKIPPHILAHPMYQLLIGFSIWISRSALDADHSGIVLVTLSQIACSLIFYVWLGKRQSRFSELFRVGLSISLPIIAPIMLFQPVDGLYYFGYIGLANYHNPTIILLKPIALLLLFYAVSGFKNELRSPIHTVIACLLTILATLLKPSFTLCLLPTVGLFLFRQIYKKIEWNFRLLVFGLLIPGILVLAIQYLFTYLQQGSNSEIAFLPLAVEFAFSSFLGWKFLLSIAFPLVVIVTFGKKAFGPIENRLVWFAFLLGAIQMYFFAETGNRFNDGNFRWSAQITLFVLFATLLRYIWKKPEWTWREWVALTVGYLPHVAAGIVYYIHCMSAKSYG